MTREPSGRKFDAEAETRKTCVNGKDASEVEDHHPEGLGRERTAFEVEALGEIGVLVRAVEPFGKGEVRFQKPLMGSEVWPCLSDEALAAGERVRVQAVDGQLLKVVKS